MNEAIRYNDVELVRHVGLIFLRLNVSKYINSLFSVIVDLIMICLQVVLVIQVVPSPKKIHHHIFGHKAEESSLRAGKLK